MKEPMKSFAEQLFGKRYVDLSHEEVREYRRQYYKNRTSKVPMPKRGQAASSKAAYRRERRARGLDQNEWNKKEANRRAASHNTNKRKLHGSELVDLGVSTAELAAWWEAQDKVCYLCGEEGKDFDHIIPLSGGGAHSLTNIRICCTSCNSIKSDKTLEELEEYIPSGIDKQEKIIADAVHTIKRLNVISSSLTELKRQY